MIDVASIRLKNLATINDEVLSAGTDPDYAFEYVDVGSVARGELVEPPEKVTFGEAPTRARRVVRVGDTIVSTVRTYLKAILPVGEALKDVIVSTGFAVVRPKPHIEPRYLAWSLQSDPFVEEVVSRSVGVSYPAIAPSALADIPITVAVQAAHQELIADFVDRETHRIDALVEAKRKQLDLLAEYRQALITAAVTGQLDEATLRGEKPVEEAMEMELPT
jgi:type I restriction enzyme S subunit